MRIRKSNTNCKGGDRREARAMAMAVVFPTRWPSLARRLFSFAIPTLRTTLPPAKDFTLIAIDN